MKNRRIIAFTIAITLAALIATACNKGNSSPSKAFQTYYEAVKNKDIKAMKSVSSKASLEEIEKLAKAMNKSLDDVLKESLEDPNRSKTPDKMPEYRNETISSDGKTATLEVKDPERDRWETIHLVKEDDGWKLGR